MSKAGTVSRHVLLLILVAVALSALAIWLGLGPVVYSRVP
jgi:hypothetical protein